MTKAEVLDKYGIHMMCVSNEEADDTFIENVKKLAEHFKEIYVSCETLGSEVQRNDNRGK